MKKNISAFTRIELVVVLTVIFAVLVAVLLPFWIRAKMTALSMCCNCNLKQISMAYRVWANDNGGQYPAKSTNGWREIAMSGKAASYCWTNYALMHSELGESTIILTCPADNRSPAPSYATLANTNISYFCNVNANETSLTSFLGGDRNLSPGPEPADDYGFSPADGRGADVTLTTNDTKICWSLKMHKRHSAAYGNILFGDGIAQIPGTETLRKDWQGYFTCSIATRGTNTDGTTRFITYSTDTMRLIFP